MAHPKEEDSKLVEVIQASSGNGDDPIRSLVRHTIQQVLEEEMTSFLNAEPYDRTDERRGYRNGYKPRVLKTRVGRLELMVPKDREGRFRTELFEKYQRSEKALVLAIAEMYVQGVSTRKVKKITEELCGLEISKSQVSALAQGLDAEIDRFRKRALVKRYPYLVVDALYEKVRQAGSVVSRGVLTVTGIDEEGYREVLGMVLKRDRAKVLALLREIIGASCRESARNRLRETVDALAETHPNVAELLDEHGEEMLAVYALPEYHRRRMRTTNMVERLNEEFRRRTRVIRVFPNEAACIRMIAVLAMETNEEWMERKYLTMNAVDMTAWGTPVTVPHTLENAPRLPHYHSTTVAAS